MNSLSRPESNLGHHSKLGKFLELIRTNSIGATENRDYGNSGILAEYCGVSISSRFRGRLQHGWAPYFTSESYYLNNYSRTFVWTKKSSDAAKHLGWHNFYDIGAPWLYLQKLLERDGWETLHTPKQSGVSDKELWVYGNHLDLDNGEAPHELINFILSAKADPNPKTILLHYRDFDALRFHDPKVIAGINVLTLGQRTNSISAQSHLFRLYDLLGRHKKLVIDWPSTLLLYAITMGCEIEFMKNSNLKTAIYLAKKTNDLELEAILSQGFHSAGSLENYALTKLGKSSIKSPTELSEILKWHSDGFNSNFILLLTFPILIIKISSGLIRKLLRN